MDQQKHYNPQKSEPFLQGLWKIHGIYDFDPQSNAPVYSIDTPPATVSGKLHLGHTYSYSHPDFIARFWRMNGYNVFYPMGFDDNGLPTGRLVEGLLGKSAEEIGRNEFIKNCQVVSENAEKDYQHLWQRLGLSIDWNFSYRTIDNDSRHIAQLSFLELYSLGTIYKKKSPAIWCPKCKTAIAQAELDDKQKNSEIITIRFKLALSENNPIKEIEFIQIATTRPELLPACVSVFVHPEDERYSHLVGGTAEVPIFNQRVPILADTLVDPKKGTGAVMCCTFGDQIDVAWWKTYKLPLVEIIDSDGRLTSETGKYSGTLVNEARREIIEVLNEGNYLISKEPISHIVLVHERCDTPIEYISTPQWFVRILDQKEKLLETGNQIDWFPEHMKNRFQSWVQNLNWDWCISRQRFFGVAFPVWYCENCNETIVADSDQLPVDPLSESPKHPCPNCGGLAFKPEKDVMDTWATSSLTPQIAGRWLKDPQLYRKVFPYSLRSQAHEIIRTWAFYTITKSKFHFDSIPWKNVLISGWGIAGEGLGKISKSRGGGPKSPMEMINLHSADAVRYWAASTGPGKDSIISEEKIKIGSKMVTKLWNVARFSCRFIEENTLASSTNPPDLSPADQWVLSKLQRLIRRVTNLFQAYDYAAAKSETEIFFWRFADNYLEMAKQRLYDLQSELREGAIFTLRECLLTQVKLFAPILPHVTEQIYQGIFIQDSSNGDASKFNSIHKASWPIPNMDLVKPDAEALGDLLIDIATFVRRYKSERKLPLGTPLSRIKLAFGDNKNDFNLEASVPDLKSITRANEITIINHLENFSDWTPIDKNIHLKIEQ
jgi:valyl-tRNA synthetase